MTLDTTVSTLGPIRLESLREFCAKQLDVPSDARWFTGCVNTATGLMLVCPWQDVGGAHLAINYQPAPQDGMVRDVEVTWITGWSSVSPRGEKPVPFHVRLMFELVTWLDGQGLSVAVHVTS